MPDISRLKEQGRLFFQKGEWEKARRAAEQVILLDSEDTEFNLYLAEIYRRAGEERQALDQFEKALRISEKAADYGRAIAACRRILAIDRERIELYNKSGELYFRMGLKSGTVREWFKYIEQLKLRSDFTGISLIYQKVAGILPENPGLKDLAGRIKQISDQLLSDTSESAPEPADIAPYRQPKKIVETQLSYARVLQRRGFIRKARAVYQKILEKDPGNEEALSKVLMLQDSSQGDLSRLQEEFFNLGRQFQESVWSRIDEAYEPYYDLGLIFRTIGLRDESIVEFQQAIKGGGRQLKAFEMLAVSFLEQGDFGLAKEVLHQGLSLKKFLDNEYVGLHYNLGLAHEQMGDLAKALSEYEQVYILDITYRDVAARLRRIEAALKLQQQRTKAEPALVAQPVSSPREVEPPPAAPPTAAVMAPATSEPTMAPSPGETTRPAAVENLEEVAVSAAKEEVPKETAAADQTLKTMAEPPQEETVAEEVEAPAPKEETVYLKDQGLSFL